MLKIIELGKFVCDRCKHRGDVRKKDGVEFHDVGFASNPKLEREGEVEKVLFNQQYWREQVFFCEKHVAEYLHHLLTDPMGQIHWELLKKVSMNPGMINTTYEQAKKDGLIR